LHDDAETIRAMGHTSFNTFRKFYQRVMTKDAANSFFSISPQSVQPATIKTVEFVA
jgi:hypothetical protein